MERPLDAVGFGCVVVAGTAACCSLLLSVTGAAVGSSVVRTFFGLVLPEVDSASVSFAGRLLIDLDRMMALWMMLQHQNKISTSNFFHNFVLFVSGGY